MGTSASEVERAIEDAARAREADLSAEARRRHGVVHTSPILARFTASKLDKALSCVGLGSLAAPGLLVVDPACGPGIFLASVMARARGGRLLGLDRDSHALESAETVLGGYARDREWELRLEHTDTLASLDVARVEGAIAILGNPPWASKSDSRAPLSETMLEDFRRDDTGARLEERKLGVLSDVYVRFWRWALEVLKLAPKGGAAALITNSSFLDGPVHRGMRGAMRRAFDSVEVYDLGGSSLVARQSRDENLFGVRPGVALTVVTRRPDTQRLASVAYVSLRGTNEQKLEALEQDALVVDEIKSVEPQHLFVPQVDPFPDDWPALDELFPFHREGVQTNRDAFATGSRDDLLRRLQSFVLGLQSPELEVVNTPLPHYEPEDARERLRQELASDPDAKTLLRSLAYRPFENRFFVAMAPVCHRPRPDLLAAMDASAFALLSVRKDRGDKPWRHFAVAQSAPDNCYFSSRSSCRTRAFPTHAPDGSANLSALATQWAEQLGSVEAVFDHALCVLASQAYRERFEGALHLGYPAIPPPVDEGSAKAGAALRALFLAGAGDEPVEIGHRLVQAPNGISSRVQACDAAIGFSFPRRV